MTKTACIKKELYNYRQKLPDEKKSDVVRHFVKLGYARRSIYYWLAIIDNGGSLERK